MVGLLEGRLASERNRNGHSVGHEDAAAGGYLSVCENSTRILELVVMMNSHLLICLKYLVLQLALSSLCLPSLLCHAQRPSRT